MQPKLCEELQKYFRTEPHVEVVCGKFQQLKEFDCMVSAANSFGLMDGGVDAAITLYYGGDLQRRVQQHIIDHFDGEQPVGTSFLLRTGNAEHPWLAHTPTMRVPMTIYGTDSVYRAMKALLRTVYDHNHACAVSGQMKDTIKTMACTGFGTFYGKMPFEEAARQMYVGYRNFLHPPTRLNWQFANQRQADVGFGGLENFMEILSEEGMHRAVRTAQHRQHIHGEMVNLAQQAGDSNYQ